MRLILLVLFIFILVFLIQHARMIKKIVGGRDKVKNLDKHPRTKSEARAVAELERLTGKRFPTVHPDFLKYKGRRLELDGFNREIGVALEFSGPLHTKWYPDKESYEKYTDRVEIDKIKRELCAKNGILLIVIDMRLPVRHYRDYFASRLYDAKKIPDAPANYIAEQQFEPFIRGIN